MLVTASAGQGLEQRASGARVVTLAGRAGTAAEAVRAEIRAASAAGPLTAAEIRLGLREIFAAHATPVRLAAFARAAGLPAGIVGGRQVAVLARAEDAAAAAELAADVARQRLRPAEVIVATAPGAAGGVTEALGGLADAGIRVIVDDGVTPASFGGKGETGRLARLAESAWAAPWPPRTGGEDTYLLDLACARECAQADAVGFGADYEFTGSLGETPPALVRRDLLLAGAPPAATWGSHGIRMFTVARA